MLVEVNVSELKKKLTIAREIMDKIRKEKWQLYF